MSEDEPYNRKELYWPSSVCWSRWTVFPRYQMRNLGRSNQVPRAVETLRYTYLTWPPEGYDHCAGNLPLFLSSITFMVFLRLKHCLHQGPLIQFCLTLQYGPKGCSFDYFLFSTTSWDSWSLNPLSHSKQFWGSSLVQSTCFFYIFNHSYYHRPHLFFYDLGVHIFFCLPDAYSGKFS